MGCSFTEGKLLFRNVVETVAWKDQKVGDSQNKISSKCVLSESCMKDVCYPDSYRSVRICTAVSFTASAHCLFLSCLYNLKVLPNVQSHFSM